MTGTCDTFKMFSFSVMQSTFRFSNVEILAVPVGTARNWARNIYKLLYNDQINARDLIGQSAVGYCAGKPKEKSCVF